MLRRASISRLLLVLLTTALLSGLFTVPASAKAGPPPKDPWGIFSLGDSIFHTYTGVGGTALWPTEWPKALNGTDYFSTGNDGENSRSISTAGSVRSGLQAVAYNATVIAASDAFITDLGVNDSELGATWEQLARQFIAAIKAENPDIVIHWITPVAEPGVVQQVQVDRAADHATTLRKLRSEGLIDVLIEWDNYALANPSVFDSDGLHYSKNGDTYAEFAAARLATVPGPTPPSPRCGSDTLPWSVWDRPLDDTIRRLYLGIQGTEPTNAQLDAERIALTTTDSLAVIADRLLTASGIVHGKSSQGTVDTLYVAILGRFPDAGGRAYWTSTLDGGLTPAELAAILSESNESVTRTNTAAAQTGRGGIVCRLYLAAHGRVPDRGGFDFWSTTGDIHWVANAIAESDEFRSRFPDPTDHDKLINSVYQRVLGRAPDQGGYNYWLERLRTDLTPGHFVLEVANSVEFTRRTNTMSWR